MAKSKILLIVLVMFGCSPKSDIIDENKMKPGYALSSEKKVKVPKSLVEKIEKKYIDLFRSANPETELTDAKILADLEKKFIDFKMFLLDANEQSALLEPVKFYLPRGGGKVDLQPYFKEKNGYFKVKLSLQSHDGEDLEHLQAFFISNSKYKKHNDQSIGSGCGFYFDVTKFAKESLLGPGVELTTLNQSHMGVLAGTYVFVSMKLGMLHLGTISLQDSRFPRAHCEI